MMHSNLSRARHLAPSLSAPLAALWAALLAVSSGCSKLPELFAFSDDLPEVSDGSADAAPCPTPRECDVEFALEAAQASKVELFASFNDYKAGLTLPKVGEGRFATFVSLANGRVVSYKFRVDQSRWITDPKRPPVGGAKDASKLTVKCKSSCAAFDGGSARDGNRSIDGVAPLALFDFRDGVMYFVLLDRFFDGDPSNNAPVADVPASANFHGGDVSGLLQKLKAGYFSQLGVNMLWISSPVDAPAGRYQGQDGRYYTGYHGYWPRELSKVEPRLGDLSLLKQLVDEAHRQGIRVVLDYVMNHVHATSTTYTSHADWFFPLSWNGHDCICGNGCAWTGSEGLRCWFDRFLPDFDFTNPDARRFSVDNALGWVNSLSVDGLRLDAIRHVETSWLETLRADLNTRRGPSEQRFYLIGETFTGDRDEIRRYIDPTSRLDGQFDFPLRAQLLQVLMLRQGKMADLDTFIDSNQTYYGPDAIMGTFLGNHDQPRSIHFGEDLTPFEVWQDGKTRAWENQPALPTSKVPFERLKLAFSALLTLPGLPTIYYGDEIAMPGAGDPDNRRPMQFSGLKTEQAAVKAYLTKLIHIRREHRALRRGRPNKLWLADDVYAFGMSDGTDQLVVVLNRSEATKTLDLTGSSYVDLLSGQQLTGPTISIEARTALILQPR